VVCVNDRFGRGPFPSFSSTAITCWQLEHERYSLSTLWVFMCNVWQLEHIPVINFTLLYRLKVELSRCTLRKKNRFNGFNFKEPVMLKRFYIRRKVSISRLYKEKTFYVYLKRKVKVCLWACFTCFFETWLGGFHGTLRPVLVSLYLYIEKSCSGYFYAFLVWEWQSFYFILYSF